jgi:hypothetical protein
MSTFLFHFLFNDDTKYVNIDVPYTSYIHISVGTTLTFYNYIAFPRELTILTNSL